jgi:membrane protein involved in colicin uptake
MIKSKFKAILIALLTICLPCGTVYATSTPTLAQQQAAQKEAAAKAAAAAAAQKEAAAKAAATAAAAAKPATTASTKATTTKTTSSTENKVADISKPPSALAKVESSNVIPGIEKTSGSSINSSGPTDTSNYLTGSPTSQ